MSKVRRPAVAVLLLAPVLGEGLSTATPPLDLLLPWTLGLMVSLYGCGALLCREIARRHGFGLAGLCLLGAAYGVYEEALVDRFWFEPRRWHDSGLDGYSAVWHTNLLLAVHLTVFHVVLSIVSSVLLVELVFPQHRGRPWVGAGGLAAAAVAFLVVVPLLFGEYTLRPLPQLLAAAALALALVAAAFAVPRPVSLWSSTVPCEPPRRLVAPLAFLVTGTHFALVYALPHTGLPWPLGIALALAPVVIGFLVLVLRPLVSGPALGRDGLRVVSGVLGFFCLLSVVIGLGGRYDQTALGLIGAVALGRLRRRAGRPCP